MKNRDYPLVSITQKGRRALDGGHPWVYEAEVKSVVPAPENGALVDVTDEKGTYLGTGLWSEHSKIRVRLVSRNANDRFDEAFFARRVGYALALRRQIMCGEESFRLIFGEADGFPGLTVDKLGSLLVAQTLSFGMDKLKSVIFPIIIEAVGGIDGLYERNDSPLREREGLEQGKGWFWRRDESVSPVTEICENGIYYSVDVENGQKTGFFLDQKFNRRAVASVSAGRHVLDCFTHTGSFALNAAAGGAASVTAVDVSAEALEMAKRNAARNGLNVELVCANVFDLLPKLEAEGKKPYDFIILDPPAFTKSRKTVQGAERGYKEINYRAMKLLPRGGLLATCSCSHFMEDDLFVSMLRSAARDASVELMQLEARQQSRDHPILLNVPETSYLKFYIFKIV